MVCAFLILQGRGKSKIEIEMEAKQEMRETKKRMTQHQIQFNIAVMKFMKTNQRDQPRDA